MEDRRKLIIGGKIGADVRGIQRIWGNGPRGSVLNAEQPSHRSLDAIDGRKLRRSRIETDAEKRLLQGIAVSTRGRVVVFEERMSEAEPSSDLESLIRVLVIVEEKDSIVFRETVPIKRREIAIEIAGALRPVLDPLGGNLDAYDLGFGAGLLDEPRSLAVPDAALNDDTWL